MIEGQRAGFNVAGWVLFSGAWLTFGAAQFLEGQP